MSKIELKNNIRRLRFEHDEMTQQELANRSGVTRQTIIAIEAGKYAPSLMLAFRIARVFNLLDTRFFNGFVFPSTGSPYYSRFPVGDEVVLGDPTRFYGARRIELGIRVGSGG